MQKGTTSISAKAVVKNVQNYVKLAKDETNKVFNDDQSALNLSNQQKEKWHKKCSCLAAFEDVEQISPLDFDHQNNMNDWLIVEKIADVTADTSIPHNYENSKF